MTARRDPAKGMAALGGLMILIPIVLVLAVLFGVILWAGFGWPGLVGLGVVGWLAWLQLRR